MAEKSDSEHGLGGRLPLQAPESLNAAQRTLYERLVARGGSEGARPFRNATDHGELIGPFNAMLHAPEIGGAFLALHEAEQRNTPLSKRLREIVIMAVASTWKSDYEIYAHHALSLRAGFLPDVVQRMIAGEAEPGLEGPEQCAWVFACELAMSHQVSDATYAHVQECFGREGVLAMTFLVGIYHVTSVVLNAFRVPAP
jgi:4-carboxymuconolactone decarboxylase